MNKIRTYQIRWHRTETGGDDQVEHHFDDEPATTATMNENDETKSATASPVHCWEDGPQTEDGCSTTCMLPDGHRGPHEWTRDDEITVSFGLR